MSTRLKSPARWIVVLLLILFLGGYLAWSRVPEYLSSAISKRINVLVQIGKIDLFPTKIGIQKLHVGNPSGYKLAEALSIGQINSNAFLGEYFKENVVIDSVELNDVYLGLEFDSIKGTQGNWTVLFSNIEASKEKAQKKAADEKPGKLLIKKLIVRNTNADVLYHDNSKGVIHLPSIPLMEFDNVSSEGGEAIDQLMSSVLGQMLKEVFVRENLKNMLQEVLTDPTKLRQYVPFL